MNEHEVSDFIATLIGVGAASALGRVSVHPGTRNETRVIIEGETFEVHVYKSDPNQCPGQHFDFGRCEREAGHSGYHQVAANITSEGETTHYWTDNHPAHV